MDRSPDPDAAAPTLVPAFDDVYDPETLARIEAGQVVPEPWWPDGAPGRTRVRSRFGIAGAVLAGVMLGVAVVYDPDPEKPTVIEQDADGEPFEGLAVQVRLDPGNPRGSEIVLRRAVV